MGTQWGGAGREGEYYKNLAFGQEDYLICAKDTHNTQHRHDSWT